MKKAIIPAAILCAVILVWLNSQPDREAETVPTPTPPQVEVTMTPLPVKATAMPTPAMETEEPIEEVMISTSEPTVEPTPAPTPMPEATPEPTPMSTPKPTPEPAPAPMPIPVPVPQDVKAGDLVYVDGFGWLESQGEGTVIHAENMYENGNKVGIMD